MVCPKCNNSAVLNEVLGKEFYYCRTCKDEVQLQSTPDPTKGLDQLHNDMLDALKYLQAPGVPIGPTSASPPNWFGYPPVSTGIGHQSPQVGPHNTNQAPQNTQNVPPPPSSYQAPYEVMSSFSAARSYIISGTQLWHECPPTPKSVPCGPGIGMHIVRVRARGVPDYMDEVSDWQLSNCCRPSRNFPNGGFFPPTP